MPILRSSKRLQSVTSPVDASIGKMNADDKDDAVETKRKVKLTVHKNQEVHQWIIVGPNELFGNGSSSDEVTFCKLPHPQNNVSSMYAFKASSVFEMMKFEDGPRSWFIDESVQKDGSMFMVTQVDPLFLVLPYFEQVAFLGKYTTLDNILRDDDHVDSMRKLQACVTTDVLRNICDVKESEDLVVFKCNQDKILEWLSRKVTSLSTYLKTSKVNVQQGAQIANFIQSSDGNNSEDNCIRYAWSMVSDYLTETWSAKLKEKFGIKDAVKTTNLPPPKRQKLNDPEPCLEDYRDTTEKSTKKANTAKVSRAQKQLNKIDKKGMKSMNSFFKPAQKKV